MTEGDSFIINIFVERVGRFIPWLSLLRGRPEDGRPQMHVGRESGWLKRQDRPKFFE